MTEFEKNPYRYLNELYKNYFQVQKTDRGYIRVSAKGLFNLFEYGRGIYWVHVETVGYGRELDGKPIIQYCVLFSVGTINDGNWQAWSTYHSKEKCQEIVEKINKEIFPDLGSMPSEEMLNELLKPFGLFGAFQP